MKNIKDYINEGLLSRKVIVNKTPIRYRPKTASELRSIIIDLLKKGQINLNCIDVSNIKYIGWLFADVNREISVKEIDISEWNVSNVTNMQNMFSECEEFNADISNWDVSNVKNMCYMFWGCKNFNSDLSHWNVKNVRYLISTFENCSNFDSDLSTWNINTNTVTMQKTFNKCTTLEKNNKIPDWYINAI